MKPTIEDAGLDRIRVQIMRDYPFFGALLHTVKWTISEKVPTAGVDGDNVIAINVKWWNSLPETSRIFIACHEILHACLLHYNRMHAFDTKEDKMLANVAADFLINFMLNESGLTVPPDGLYNAKYSPDTYTVETLMNELRKDKNMMQKIKQKCQEEGGGRNGDGAGQGNDIMDGKSKSDNPEKDKREQEQNMKMAMSSAVAIAKRRGNLPACIERMVDEMLKPATNWKAELHEWFNVKIKDVTTWNKPNRRFVWQRKIFPSKYSVGCGHIGVSIDVSGSIGQHELAVFESELNHLIELCKPSKVTVVYFDTSVKCLDEFEEFPIKLKSVGGGGTDFSCAFDHFNSLPEPVTGLVFMTDMYGEWPSEPNYPVCVLSTTEKMVAPYGKTIYADLKNETL